VKVEIIYDPTTEEKIREFERKLKEFDEWWTPVHKLQMRGETDSRFIRESFFQDRQRLAIVKEIAKIKALNIPREIRLVPEEGDVINKMD